MNTTVISFEFHNGCDRIAQNKLIAGGLKRRPCQLLQTIQEEAVGVERSFPKQIEMTVLSRCLFLNGAIHDAVIPIIAAQHPSTHFPTWAQYLTSLNLWEVHSYYSATDFTAYTVS